ncbi:CoA pyrophosphatase [Deferribacteraceae bacterium V6Fe1]|nr:CoA pyrophosphatase [Deferribacteraceae bacterium V6Fe1]
MILHKLKKDLSKKKPVFINQDERLAAVMIPLIKSNFGYEIIFTKRHNNLPTHAGEVSFPGGIKEKNDPSLEATAIRETVEEIGINANHIEIIGRLDDEMSIHKFKVAPFLGYINANTKIEDLKFQKCEVERVFSVPIEYFLTCQHWKETWVRKDDKVTVHFYPYKDLIIWGLTGRILSKLLKIVSEYLK